MQIRVLIRDKGASRPLLLYYIDPHTGREVSKSAGTRERREAERAAARWEKELEESPPAKPGTQWDTFRRRFEDEHTATLSGPGAAAYGTALNHLQRILKPKNVGDITADSLSQFQAKLLAEKRPSTSIANYLTHIRTALNFAQHVGLIDRAPKVRLPKTPKRKLMRGRPLTRQEARRFIRAMPLEWRRLGKLIYLSGLRIGEAMRLSWDREPLVVQLDAQPYPQIVYYAEGHKRSEDVTAPIPPDLAAWLRMTPPESRRGRVAPTPLRTKRKASAAIKAAGVATSIQVAGRHPMAHDLRRSYAAKWAARVRPLTLQRMMRHGDITTTLKFYIGLDSVDASAELWSRKRRRK